MVTELRIRNCIKVILAHREQSLGRKEKPVNKEMSNLTSVFSNVTLNRRVLKMKSEL